MAVALSPGLERRLKAGGVGDVRFDGFTRGRYATDASHYQIMPLGVLTPRTMEEAQRAIGICRAERVPVTPRHIPGRTDGEPIRGDRLLAASEPGA